MLTKIIISFLVVAIVYGTSIDRRQPAGWPVGASCPLFCTDEWDPICGSDGVTYGNKCEFHIAHCKDPSLQSVHQGSCN